MKWIVCLFAALFSFVAVAQTDTPKSPSGIPVRRDAAAVALLTKSLAAMGGGSLSTGGGVIVQGQMIPAGGGAARTFQAKYKLIGNGVAFRKEVTWEKGTTVFASGGGNAVWRSADGKSGRFKSHVAVAALPIDVPIVMFAYALSNPNYNFELIAAGDSSTPAHLRFQDVSNGETASVTAQHWYFDPATALPIRVEYRIPDVVDNSFQEKGTCDYIGFQTLSGVLVPAKTRCFEGKQFVSEETIVSLDPNGSFAPGFDTVPGGLQ